MSTSESSAAQPKRTHVTVLREIEQMLATMDGISIADAFRLGGLVREYGACCAGDAAGQIMTPMIDKLLDHVDRASKPKPPWEQG